jgi:hypothetical protein
MRDMSNICRRDRFAIYQNLMLLLDIGIGSEKQLKGGDEITGTRHWQIGAGRLDDGRRRNPAGVTPACVTASHGLIVNSKVWGGSHGYLNFSPNALA